MSITSLEKYIDSTALMTLQALTLSSRMTTELLRPGYSNISCTEDQCVFSGAMMSTELEVLVEKKW